IEDKFLELTSDYDKFMEDLQFTFVIAQDIQKRYDRVSLESDLAEINEFLTHFRENVQGTLKFVQGPLSILHQEVSIIRTQLGTDTQILAPRIDPTLLKDIEPEEPSINSSAVAKKFYTKNAIAVSCETIMDPIRFNRRKSKILGKLGECPSILKFFGVSTIKDSITLREYEITNRLEPKLANFHFAKVTEGISSNLESVLLEIHWMASEKMIEHMFLKNAKKRRYTQQSWAHDPEERISIGELYIMLANMQSKYVPFRYLPDVLPNKVMNLDDEVLNDIEEILEADQGIELHVTRDTVKKKEAWKCFVANATKGHPKAIFWKGYYLWEGIKKEHRR
ncbi:17571_t:CDS:2, partial [Cetraspora pellucida]